MWGRPESVRQEFRRIRAAVARSAAAGRADQRGVERLVDVGRARRGCRTRRPSPPTPRARRGRSWPYARAPAVNAGATASSCAASAAGVELRLRGGHRRHRALRVASAPRRSRAAARGSRRGPSARSSSSVSRVTREHQLGVGGRAELVDAELADARLLRLQRDALDVPERGRGVDAARRAARGRRGSRSWSRRPRPGRRRRRRRRSAAPRRRTAGRVTPARSALEVGGRARPRAGRARPRAGAARAPSRRRRPRPAGGRARGRGCRGRRGRRGRCRAA